MKLLRKRRIASLMLVVILFLMTDYIGLPVLDAAPAEINGFANPCGYNPAVDGAIPTGVQPCSDPKDTRDKGFKFNSEFYYKKIWRLNGATPPKTVGKRYLIVYGNPLNVPSSVQDYTKGWQPGDYSTVINPIDGEGHFFVWDAKYSRYTYGEYRFLGFDATGSLFPNDHYIRDDSTTKPLEQKHWVFQPWTDLPSGYKYKPSGAGLVYKDRPVIDEDFTKIRDNIIRSLDFTIQQGVKYADRYTVLPDNQVNRDPRNYMNIPQAATAREPGIGMMYHYSHETHSIWYQSFPLLQLKGQEKIQNPAACAVSPIDEGPIPLGKERFVEVEVKVTGTLQDELHYGDIQYESLFYTRKDVDYWLLDLKDVETDKYISLSSNNKVDHISHYL